jgi:hypothetical protein
MKDVNDCYKYNGEFSKATKANSFVADGRIVMILKKDYIGKTSSIHIAYDSFTKVQLMAHHDKDILIKYLQTKDLSVLGEDTTRLF